MPMAAADIVALIEDVLPGAEVEMRDLAGKPSSLPQMKKLFARFRQLQTELDDTLELASVYPELTKP